MYIFSTIRTSAIRIRSIHVELSDLCSQEATHTIDTVEVFYVAYKIKIHLAGMLLCHTVKRWTKNERILNIPCTSSIMYFIHSELHKRSRKCRPAVINFVY